MDWFEKVLAGIGAAWGVAAVAGLLFGRKPRPGDVATGALHEGRAYWSDQLGRYVKR